MKPFEREVVRLLAAGRVDANVLARLFTAPEASYEHSGWGYFLTLRDSALPSERIVLGGPVVLGRVDETEVGFVVFIEDHELTLECHGWGDEVPADIRERDVAISVTQATG